MLTTVNSAVVDKMVSTLNEAVLSINSDIDTIDERYEKMKAEESAGLIKQLEVVNSQLEYWNKMKEGAPVEEKKTRKPRAKKTEEAPAPEPVQEEVVVDTIFPENNGTQVEETVESAVEETVPEPEAPSDEGLLEPAEDGAPIEEVIEDIQWKDGSEVSDLEGTVPEFQETEEAGPVDPATESDDFKWPDTPQVW